MEDSKNTSKILLCLFFLNILDSLLTVILINHYGIECEVNPIMKHALEHLGIYLWAVSKSILGGLVLGFAHFRIVGKLISKYFRVTCLIVLYLYIIIVINGFIQVIFS